MDRPLMHSSRTVVRAEDCDPYLHLNHAAYLKLFEEARWKWMTEHGYSDSFVTESGLGPVVLEAKVRFVRELCAGESVRIDTYLIHYHRRLQRVAQTMIKIEGEMIACEAEFSFALFDLKRRALVSASLPWASAFRSDDPS